jgi:4-amino-4-deoxy-L-arabinose transferase-like glycosyltransferase
VLRRILRGRLDDPAWVRPALLGLLAATAVLYLWSLGASGNANSFYAAAVKSGTESWKAFFFGSLDSANFITVDKPPASLWVMALSGRIFGFNSWSMLVPQALEGVAAVGLLYAMVRRWSGPAAGLAAGAVLAVTPSAVLMFRYNNPDALLTLLLVVAAYALTRAIERGQVSWLLVAGGAIGLGFLTKMLQAFLVLPALALVYMVAAPIGWRRRLAHLAAGAGAIVVSAGWWVAIVELWPADGRPYIGGSTTNSVLQLALGYNGLGRVFGGDGNAGGGGGMGGLTVAFGGSTGIGRLFNDTIGGEVSWLLPAALIGLVSGLWLTGRAPRTDPTRAALMLWGGWLLVTAGVFSYMQGTFHPYYTIVLAPPMGALVAIGGRELWMRRDTWLGRGGLAAMATATGAWGTVLLWRTPSWQPILRYLLITATVVTVAALPSTGLPRVVTSLPRAATWIVLASAVITSLLGSTGYAIATAQRPHNGAIPAAGPAAAGRTEFPLGMSGLDFPGGSTAGSGGFPTGGLPAGGFPSGGFPGGLEIGGLPGGMPGGGFGQQDSVDGELAAILNDTETTWAAATLTSSSAASLSLASGRAVMGIGGFTGSDPAPTLAQFQQYVAAGKVRYFIGTSMPGFGQIAGNGSTAGNAIPGFGGANNIGSQISTWVQERYQTTTIGTQTVYDFTKPKS